MAVFAPTGAIALIDCENLTDPNQLAAAIRWRSAGRVELFGREINLRPWRAALAGHAIAVAAETVIAPDAPSQAADLVMAARAESLVAEGLVIIASDDLGFERLAGVARWPSLDAAGLLALVVEELGGGDWVGLGGVGDHMARRFRLSLRGRLDHLARKAGVEIRMGKCGPELRPNSSHR
jgi:hypothetical protein